MNILILQGSPRAKEYKAMRKIVFTLLAAAMLTA